MPSTIDRVRARALEVGVYLPLGAYSKVRDQIADLGPQTIRRTFDDLVARGQDRLSPVERRMQRGAEQIERDVKAAATDARTAAAGTTGAVKRSAGRAATSASKPAKRTVQKGPRRARAAAPTRIPSVATPRSAGELPIERYDALTAEEIVPKLRGLTQTDLAKIYKYERKNQDRATIAETIEGRLQPLPLATYDALTAEEITARLEKKSERDLRTLRRYEAETKNRQTVIDKIDSLLA